MNSMMGCNKKKKYLKVLVQSSWLTVKMIQHVYVNLFLFRLISLPLSCPTRLADPLSGYLRTCEPGGVADLGSDVYELY